MALVIASSSEGAATNALLDFICTDWTSMVHSCANVDQLLEDAERLLWDRLDMIRLTLNRRKDRIMAALLLTKHS